MEYDYVPLPARNSLSWPGGARVALILTINLETWDLTKDSDRAYYAGGPSILPDALAGNIPDFPNYSWREYGQRVGIWRLIDVFDQLGVAPSCTTNAVTFQRRRAMTDAVLARGWELITHNWEQGETAHRFRARSRSRAGRHRKDTCGIREACRPQIERLVVVVAAQYAKHGDRPRRLWLPLLLRHHERRPAVHDPDRKRSDCFAPLLQRDQ